MNVNPSPLFEPVLWDGDGFKILDETLVPEEIHYIQISEVEQALDAVREMKTRAFGQVLAFLYSGALLAQRDTHSDAAALRARIAEMTQQFCDARPTFDFRGLECFFDEWFDPIACRRRRRRDYQQAGARIRPADHARAASPGAPGGRHIAESGAVVDALQRER